VGQRLKQAMDAKGISANRLAKATGVHRTTIGDYREGTTSPTISWLVQAAGILECPVPRLLTGGSRTGIDDQLAAWAPACIPEAERERFGWLAVSLKSDLGKRTPNNEALTVTLKLITAMLAALRAARGENRVAPEGMLEELRRYSPQRWREYVLFSLMAANLVVQPARVETRR
jgi:transcriptional regulator with XRE-family HTH domain